MLTGIRALMLVALVLFAEIPGGAASDASSPPPVPTGATPAQVEKALGKPKGQFSAGGLTIWTYPRGEVEFLKGRVARVKWRANPEDPGRLAADAATAVAGAIPEGGGGPDVADRDAPDSGTARPSERVVRPSEGIADMGHQNRPAPTAETPEQAAETDRLIGMLKDPNQFKREKAANRLGELRSPRAIGPLAALLQDEYPYVRADAVRALARIGGPDVVAPLIQAVRGEDYDVVSCAATALGDVADPRAVQPLFELIQARGHHWEVALDALGRIGEPALPGLRRLLADPQFYHRGSVLAAVAKTGPAGVDALIELLDQGREEDRETVVRVLGDSGDSRAVPPLIETLRNPRNRGVSASAIQSLGKLADRRALDPLIAALDLDPSAAVTALADLGDPRAASAILQVAVTGDPDVQWRALKALGDLYAGQGKPGVSAGTPTGEAGDVRDKSIPQVSEVVSVLLGALGNGDQIVRSSAAEALGEVGDARAIPALVPLLFDHNYLVQPRAAAALDAVGWRPADDREQAAHLLAKRDWKGLAAMRERAVEFLIAAFSARDANDRYQVVDLLGKTGDRHAVEPLIRLLRNESEEPGLRERARIGLEALGGPEARAALADYRKEMVAARGRFFLWTLWGLWGSLTLALLLAARRIVASRDLEALTGGAGAPASGDTPPTSPGIGAIGRLVFGWFLPLLAALLPTLLLLVVGFFRLLEAEGTAFSGGGGDPLRGAMHIVVLTLFLVCGGSLALAAGSVLSIPFAFLPCLKSRRECFLTGCVLFLLPAWIAALLIAHGIEG